MESTGSKIAVLMTTYNGEKYLKCQIDSILAQDVDFHLFIRDDGSTDNTKSIIQGYNDSRITLIEGENIGVNKGFLTLLKFAKTLPEEYQYFSFSDQDDQWHEDKLQTALKFITKISQDKPRLYGSASLHVDESLVPLEENTKRVVKPLTLYNTIIQTIVPGHTYLFNRALLDMLSDSLSEKNIYFYDGFILNVAVMTGSLIYDGNRHTNYRQHSGNIMGNQKDHPLKWLKMRLKRLKSGDSKKYARQIEYLFKTYADQLPEDKRKELYLFLSSRKNIIKRLKYIRKTKLYRQKKLQTALFKLLYISGGYN